MLVGHFAVSLAGKSIAPQVSLGTLVAAAMASDLAWPLFMLAGFEHVEFSPGSRGVISMRADIAYSHGLLTCAIGAVLFAAVYYFRRRDRTGALVISAAVLSHWLLDFASHPPDMALAPGMPLRLGLGLWNSIPATLVVEGAMWAAGILVYTRATRPRSRAGSYVFWIGVGLLTAAWLNNITAPPPPDVASAMRASFLFFVLAVTWAYWVNRLRPAKVTSG
jgi:hypothetical protein